MPNTNPANTPSGSAPDPRLQIPEVLRTPVQRPESMLQAGRSDAGPSGTDSVEAAKGWAIAMNFVYGVVAGALVGWVIQYFIPAWAPVPILVGLGAGLIGGFVRFVREAIKANNAPGSSASHAPKSGV